MNALFDAVALVWVLALLGVLVYALYRLTPFPHQRTERYRDPETGRRRWASPRLD